MGFFTKSKSKGELVAVFDIGSASIGGALVLLPGDESQEKVKILSSVRLPIKLEEHYSFERLLGRMSDTLEEVALQIKKEGNAQKVFCFLASPWYKGCPRLVKYEQSTPFVFTQEMHESLVEKELTAVGENKSGSKIIESKSVQIVLNGYVTGYPLGQKATTLEMSLLIGLSSDKVLQSIEEKLKVFFKISRVSFMPFLSPLFTVRRDLFPEQNDFLVMDIGGEVTDIALVRNGALCDWLSFPLGKNFFIRSIAIGLRRTKEEADSLFSLYLDHRIEQKIYRKIDHFVQIAKEEWVNYFQKSLYQLSRDLSLPSTIFLTVDDNIAVFFEDLIRGEKFTQYHLTSAKFDVKVLSAKLLHRFCDFAYTVEERDPFLILESIYLRK